MPASTLWIDVTELERWTGPFTGIQRVIYEAAVRAVADGARLVVFRPATATFEEIEPGLLTEMVARSREPARRRRPRGTTIPAKVRDGVRATWRLTRLSLRRRQIRSAARRRAERPSTGWAPFAAGDMVLIAGLVIRQEGIAATMRAAHRDTGVHFAVIVYDLIPLTWPHVVPERTAALFASEFPPVVQAADLVVAISHTTAAELDRLGLRRPDQRPTSVVTLAAAAADGGETEPVVLHLGDQPFILMVGTFEIRKNYTLAYQVYRLAAERGIPLPRLVIVGRAQGWLATDIHQTIRRDPVVADSIVLAHDIDDDNRRWLYRHCQLVLMTSVVEGWGLPLTEARAYGKVCVSSDIPSAREALGDLAVYFSPYDAGQCLDRLVDTLDDQRRIGLEAAVAAAPYRTWDQYYDDLVAALGGLAHVA